MEIPLTQLPEIIARIPKNMEKIAVSTLNGTAFHAVMAMKEEMRNKLDRPKKFTLNTFYYIKATEDKLEAIVTANRTDGRLDASNTIYPLIYGGKRGNKPYEKLLQEGGILPQGAFYVPTKMFPKDQYGNPKSGEIIKILSQTRSFKESGSASNKSTSKQSKKKREVYEYKAAPKPGETDNRMNTIYRINKSSGKRIPYLIPVKSAPNYKPIMQFEEVVGKAYNDNVQQEFTRAFQKYGIL